MLDVKAINELLILGVLRRRARHGYEIALEVERRSGERFLFQHGTLYPILHRLEAEGWIEGRWERAEGRRRKVYALTVAGQGRLREGIRELEADVAAVFEVLKGQVDESLSDAS